jgi:hypothetical protein
MIAAVLLLTFMVSPIRAFQPAHRTFRGEHVRPLGAVITADDTDFDLDVGRGGVRLAEESVIKITGNIKHAPGKAEPQVKDLLRYTELTLVNEADLPKENFKIIATGRGKELYKDPGETTEKIIIYGPLDAVRDALSAAGAASDCARIVINFAGGDDLQVLEVLEAAEKLVLGLDAVTKAIITFNSMSHGSLPLSQTTITIVGLGEENTSGGLTGAQKSLSNGEVYFVDGKYWTVSPDNINTAVA